MIDLKDVYLLKELPVGTQLCFFRTPADEVTTIMSGHHSAYRGRILVKSSATGDKERNSDPDARIAKDHATFLRLKMGKQLSDGWLLSLPEAAIVSPPRYVKLMLSDGLREWDE